jgi:hypothetical protein
MIMTIFLHVFLQLRDRLTRDFCALRSRRVFQAGRPLKNSERLNAKKP